MKKRAKNILSFLTLGLSSLLIGTSIGIISNINKSNNVVNNSFNFKNTKTKDDCQPTINEFKDIVTHSPSLSQDANNDNVYEEWVLGINPSLYAQNKCPNATSPGTANPNCAFYDKDMLSNNGLYMHFKDANGNLYSDSNTFWNDAIQEIGNNVTWIATGNKNIKYEISGLEAKHFDQNNNFTKNNLNLLNNSQTIEDVLKSPFNNNGGRFEKAGWKDKHASGAWLFQYKATPSNGKTYEKGNSSRVIQNLKVKDDKLIKDDQLSGSNSAFNQYETQIKNELTKIENAFSSTNQYSFKNGQQSWMNTIDELDKEYKTSLKNIDEIKNKLSAIDTQWQNKLKELLGNTNNGINLNENEIPLFIKKWKNIENNFKEQIRNKENELQTLIQEFKTKTSTYRPKNFFWLTTSFDFENDETIKNGEKVIQELTNIYTRRDEEFNKLLKDKEIVEELTDIKNGYYWSLWNSFNNELNKLNATIDKTSTLQSTLAQANVTITRIQQFARMNSRYGDTIHAKIELENANFENPKTPTESWITNKEDFWYITNGSNPKQLFSRSEIIKLVSNKIIQLIKEKDLDFDYGPNQPNVISEQQLTFIDNKVQTTTHNVEIGTNKEHKYNVSVFTNYKVENGKVTKVEFDVTAKNTTIENNNLSIKEIIDRTNKISENIDLVLTKTKNLYAQVEAQKEVITNFKINLDNKITEKVNPNIVYNLTSAINFEEMKKQFSATHYQDKLNWLAILIVVLAIIFIIILIILLMMLFKKRSKYRYSI